MKNESNSEGDISFRISDRLPQQEERKKGVFNKIKKFFPFFKQEKHSDVNLGGRIHTQLQKDAHKVVQQLKNLKENLRKELDEKDESHLWNSFEAVVNPLLREYGNIEKKLIDEESFEEKTSAIKSYNEWIEKAKMWVALSSKPSNREGIIKAVIHHTMQVSDMLIDRDLKTLREYMAHEINVLGLDHEKLSQTATKIESALTPHLNELHALKHSKPIDLQLEHLQEWKSRLDERRAKHYNDALHIIDQFVNSLLPASPEDSKYEEEHEHLKEIFNLVAYLEEEVPVFLGELKQFESLNQEEKLMMKEHGVYLEQAVHKLNTDLRLTPELADRVQLLIQAITAAQEFIRKATG